jgi:hypothetical protein
MPVKDKAARRHFDEPGKVDTICRDREGYRGHVTRRLGEIALKQRHLTRAGGVCRPAAAVNPNGYKRLLLYPICGTEIAAWM